MLRKFGFVLSLLVIAAMVAPMVSAQEVVVAPDEALKIGLATTQSGEGLVPLGDDIVRGVELALDDRPTVTVDGVEFAIEVDVQDDQCNVEGGQVVANRFASDESVVGVIGPMCSNACRGAGPIFDEAGYTSISSSCTGPDLSDPDQGYASFNRTPPNDSLQGAAAATFAYNELGLRRVATIHDGSIYGESLVNVFTISFEDLGGEVVFADAVNVGDTDFRSLLDDIAAEDPEMLYFGGFPAEGARLAEQRADAGLADLAFMGADGINGPEFIRLAGEAAEGAYASSPSAPDTEAVAALVERYIEKYGLEPTAPFHGYAADATNMLLDAIEAVGTLDDDGNLVVDRAALLEYVRSYGQDEPVEGLTGTLVCDGTGDCATGGIGFYQVTDGEFVKLEYYFAGGVDEE